MLRLESLLVGDAGKTPNLTNGNQAHKVKECFAMTNWTKKQINCSKIKQKHDMTY